MTDEFFAAIDRDDVATLQLLLAGTPSLASTVTAEGVSPLLRAQYRQSKGAVAVLRAHLEELSLHEAAAISDLPALMHCLDQGVAIETLSADGFTALQIGAFFGHSPVVELLLGRGADPDAVAVNPMQIRALHAAAASGSLPCVELLLARGASADVRQQGNYTALHAAAAQGHDAMVRVLLIHGADPLARARDGLTARDLATRQGHQNVVDLLLKAECRGD